VIYFYFQVLHRKRANNKLALEKVKDIATAKVVRTLPVTEPFGYAQDQLRRSGHFDYAQ